MAQPTSNVPTNTVRNVTATFLQDNFLVDFHTRERISISEVQFFIEQLETIWKPSIAVGKNVVVVVVIMGCLL